MAVSEEREEGGPTSKTTLSGKHGRQRKAQSLEQQERPDSPVPSCVSMKRPDSPVPSCVSMKSDQSMDIPYAFKDGNQPNEQKRVHQERPDSTVPSSVSMKRPDSPVPSCVSMKSDQSMDIPYAFKAGNQPTEQKRVHQERPDSTVPSSVSMKRPDSPVPSCVSMKSDRSMDIPFAFKDGNQPTEQRVLFPDYPQCSERQTEDEEEEDEIPAVKCQHEIKSHLKKKFLCLFEGIAKAGQPTLLNQSYTELYITEGGSGEVNQEHEVRQIETASRRPAKEETLIKCEDIFKPLPGQDQPIRTIMTMGVAGIGKTVLTQKFSLEWAEGKANQDIDFIFPLTFRELNLLKEKNLSLMELLHHFFIETKGARIFSYDKFKVIFVLDGLDECRLPLDFQNNQICTDVTESTSVDVLLTNLIRGNLLPSASIWVTTRPAAANQIPAECVDMMTEVRGFTDPQKEEYLRKKLLEETLARRIISHVKTSRSLHIMCHIPVFCWITATVLENVLTTSKGQGEVPNTLTEMYIHFLWVQSIQGKKYHGRDETDPQWSRENRKIILSLGKLAFIQLEKGNLIFYEADLAECGIDMREASVCSGVFTQIFKEECGLYQDRVFCFVHLSIQEFMAALYVFMSFMDTGVNLLSEEQSKCKFSKLLRKKSDVQLLYQSAVDKALQSENGHLDLFLRFLLGLSLETNQTLLQSLLGQTGQSLLTNQKTVRYIKEKINEGLSPERSINLLHCLNELKDHSLVEEIQQYLTSGSLSDRRLSPGCLVTQEGCCSLVSALTSNPFHLRELDLSYNHPGVALLSAGLEDPRWRLDTLSVEHGGAWMLTPGLRKYACELTLDPNTAHRELSLSEDNRKVTWVKDEQSYPDHPERFTCCKQVLCREGLTGRCYWEVKMKRRVVIGVTYRGITRRGEGDDSCLGMNNQSWSLDCSGYRYSAWYNNIRTDIRLPPTSVNRVGVYVDCSAGTLSFYRVSPHVGESSDTLTHIHTFQTTFTQDLYPGFRLRKFGSKVSLCQL